MLKPDFIEFKDGDLAPAPVVNYNFEQMGNYVFGTADELKALVNSAVANISLQLSQAVFTGMIIPYAGKVDNIPNGWLLCDGREVSREEYKKLYEAIDIEKYGAGNGVTTFNLPNYMGKFLEGGTEAGIEKEAKIPNIKGFLNSSLVNSGADGAFQSIAASGQWGGGSYRLWSVQFDASRSNPIYSDDCKTVQPPSVTTLYIIKT